MNHKILMLPSALAALMLCESVSGQTPKDDAPERASRGQVAYDEGRYEQAAQLLSDALRAYPLPSIAYLAGQAQEKLNKLAEAAEFYRQAAELEPSWQGRVVGEALEKQKTAKSEAAEALVGLQARIPQLTLRLQSAAPEAVTVTLDAAVVPAALLGQPRPLNPGRHVVKATAECGDQDEVESREVTVAEGQHQELVLKPVCPTAAPPAATEPTTPPAPPSVSAGPVTESGLSRASLVRTLGWVGVGLGSAGLVASAVTAATGESIRADACRDDNTCDYENAEDVGKYNSLRTWSTVSFWVGLPVLAGGVGALFWDKHEQDHGPKDQGVTAWVGFGSVGLRGRFQ